VPRRPGLPGRPPARSPGRPSSRRAPRLSPEEEGVVSTRHHPGSIGYGLSAIGYRLSGRWRLGRRRPPPDGRRSAAALCWPSAAGHSVAPLRRVAV